MKVTFDSKPWCATYEEWQGWLSFARRGPPGPAGFCEDCTDEYQTEMKRKGKCLWPEIVFDEFGNGTLPNAEEEEK